MAAIGSDRVTFDVLNGLRGVAAIAVVNAHLVTYFAGYKSANVGLAVDFFFMLSGFVVAHAYEDRLLSGFGTGRFIAARLIRLYPVYFLGNLVGALGCWFVWNWSGSTNLIVSFATSSFLVPPPPSYSANSWNLFPLDPPAWSLLFELLVNILYAFIFRYLSNRVLRIFLVAAFINLAICGYMAGTTDLGVKPEQFGGGIARALFSYFMGIALHRVWLRRRVAFSAHPALLFGLLVLPLLFPTDVKLVWLYDLAVTALYFPVLLSVAARSSGSRAWVLISAVLGAASYPLYILHLPLFEIVKGTIGGPLESLSPWSGLVLVPILLAASWAIETFAEIPLRRAMNRKFLGRRTGLHPSSPSVDGQASAATR